MAKTKYGEVDLGQNSVFDILAVSNPDSSGVAPWANYQRDAELRATAGRRVPITPYAQSVASLSQSVPVASRDATSVIAPTNVPFNIDDDQLQLELRGIESESDREAYTQYYYHRQNKAKELQHEMDVDKANERTAHNLERSGKFFHGVGNVASGVAAIMGASFMYPYAASAGMYGSAATLGGAGALEGLAFPLMFGDKFSYGSPVEDALYGAGFNLAFGGAGHMAKGRIAAKEFGKGSVGYNRMMDTAPFDFYGMNPFDGMTEKIRRGAQGVKNFVDDKIVRHSKDLTPMQWLEYDIKKGYSTTVRQVKERAEDIAASLSKRSRYRKELEELAKVLDSKYGRKALLLDLDRDLSRQFGAEADRFYAFKEHMKKQMDRYIALWKHLDIEDQIQHIKTKSNETYRIVGYSDVPINEQTSYILDEAVAKGIGVHRYVGYRQHDKAPLIIKTPYPTFTKLQQAVNSGKLITEEAGQRQVLAEVLTLLKEHPNTKISGSSILYLEGWSSTLPQDFDLYKDLGILGPRTEMVGDKKIFNLNVEDVRKQVLAYSDPDEYLRIVRKAFEETFKAANDPNNISPKIVYPEFPAITLEQFDPLRQSFLDAFMANKPKHQVRVHELFTKAPEELVVEAVQLKRHLMGHKDLVIPKVDLSNIEANKEFLRQAAFAGDIDALASSPKRMQAFWEHMYQNRVLQRRRVGSYPNTDKFSMIDYMASHGSRFEGAYTQKSGWAGYDDMEMIFELVPKEGQEIKSMFDVFKPADELFQGIVKNKESEGALVIEKSSKNFKNPQFIINRQDTKGFIPSDPVKLNDWKIDFGDRAKKAIKEYIAPVLPPEVGQEVKNKYIQSRLKDLHIHGEGTGRINKRIGHLRKHLNSENLVFSRHQHKGSGKYIDVPMTKRMEEYYEKYFEYNTYKGVDIRNSVDVAVHLENLTKHYRQTLSPEARKQMIPNFAKELLRREETYIIGGAAGLGIGTYPILSKFDKLLTYEIQRRLYNIDAVSSEDQHSADETKDIFEDREEKIELMGESAFYNVRIANEQYGRLGVKKDPNIHKKLINRVGSIFDFISQPGSNVYDAYPELGDMLHEKIKYFRDDLSESWRNDYEKNEYTDGESNLIKARLVRVFFESLTDDELKEFFGL